MDSAFRWLPAAANLDVSRDSVRTYRVSRPLAC